jgi:putative DNA methylase
MADAHREARPHDRNGTNALASSIVLVCRPRPPTAPRPRAASSSPRSRPSCRGRSPTSSAATSRRWTWRRRPSARAWRSTPATPRCSTPRASRSACVRRWRSSTRRSTRRWPSRRATSTPTAAGRSPGSSRTGFAEGDYGVAEQLSKSKNTSVAGMVEAGILESKRGKVRLLKPSELPADWDPSHRPAPHRVGDRPPPDPRARSGGEGAAAAARRQARAKAESPANWLPPLHPLRAQEARPPRRSPTTAWSRAGPRSPALEGSHGDAQSSGACLF